MFDKILLCTHGSPGAQKAEQLVFTELIEYVKAENITILTIIDADWSELSTDDWLNTSKTRTTFKDYVQEQLSREIEADWQRIRESYPDAARSCFSMVVGGIEETIAESAENLKSNLVVLGPRCIKPRRLFSVRMEPGLANQISSKKLHPLLPCPLLIAP